jgi:hypothetical protein
LREQRLGRLVSFRRLWWSWRIDPVHTWHFHCTAILDPSSFALGTNQSWSPCTTENAHLQLHPRLSPAPRGSMGCHWWWNALLRLWHTRLCRGLTHEQQR